MAARVRLTTEAREDLADLDGAARKIVAKALLKLQDGPEQRGAPLGSTARENLTTFRKLVVGKKDYRIVYRVELDGSVVVVWVIAKRADRECYDLARARLQTYEGDPAMTQQLKAMIDGVWATTEP